MSKLYSVECSFPGGGFEFASGFFHAPISRNYVGTPFSESL
jgi:hypothetical protein